MSWQDLVDKTIPDEAKSKQEQTQTPEQPEEEETMPEAREQESQKAQISLDEESKSIIEKAGQDAAKAIFKDKKSEQGDETEN
jgi:hypothetical protein